MSRSLAEEAEWAGIDSSYISETGEHRIISDEIKRALLDAMEIADHEASERGAPHGGPATVPCFVPDWLRNGRAWGVSAQLYGVRSARNAGIGDFEDLARLAELFAAKGAEFIGVNPLHALFTADPECASPYWPSSRRFLNPMYIAVDRVAGTDSAKHWTDKLQALRQADLVDYGGVQEFKFAVLESAFAKRDPDPAFEAFCASEGVELDRFATFEALSHQFTGEGFGAGWQSWPTEFHDPMSPDVVQFAAQHAHRIAFHKWLQWVAADQLADAHRRATAAGMRIGIYLDLAVGVSPDGAAPWSDRELFATRARIGAPPDMFNHLGQDWGLAPMKPTTLAARALVPFESELAASMATAGAIRLDHVMSLMRLYWVPSGADARVGGYVRYPLEHLLAALGRGSQDRHCIVIGEDLGTVPPGFREMMQAHGILGYRVLYFERGDGGVFNPPTHYPREALACVATHDLPPLRGWWREADIDARERCGFYPDAGPLEHARADRRADRARLLEAVGDGTLANLSTTDMADDIFVAVHRHMARTPCWLFALQLEDLAGAVEMVNLPGTDRQHANWRRKLPVLLEELAGLETLRRTVEAVAAERPRCP
jgi:4-alpha-glucanotransferase